MSKIEVRVSLNWFRGKYQNNDIIWHVGLSLESLHIILGKTFNLIQFWIGKLWADMGKVDSPTKQDFESMNLNGSFNHFQNKE